MIYYYIDYIPNINFLEKIKKPQNSNLILNIYVEQIPTMNTHKELYIDYKETPQIIKEIKEKGYLVNLIFDAFCLGNREFSKEEKTIFSMIDNIMALNIDAITITNHFFLNYIKNTYQQCKTIVSEYAEITNIQKITRYIEDIGIDAVKIDTKLAKNIEAMKQIKQNFDMNKIHINLNKVIYENDIYAKAFYNSISHLIQDKQWDELNDEIRNYKLEQQKLKNKKIELEEGDIKKLKELGYKNFWYNYVSTPENYIKEIQKNP